VVVPSPLKPQPPPAARAAVKGNPFRRDTKAAPSRRLPDLDDEPEPMKPTEDPAPMQDAAVSEYGGEYFDDDGTSSPPPPRPLYFPSYKAFDHLWDSPCSQGSDSLVEVMGSWHPDAF